MGNEWSINPIFNSHDELLYQRLAFFELGAKLADQCATVFGAVDNGVKDNFEFIREEFQAETNRLWLRVDANLERKDVAFVDSVGREEKSLFREHFNRAIQMQPNVRSDGF